MLSSRGTIYEFLQGGLCYVPFESSSLFAEAPKELSEYTKIIFA
jgi:hypothetical protein